MASSPFSNALVMRMNGTLVVHVHVGVYGKQTHTDRCLPFKSHHLLNVKRGVVQCLLKRVEEIITEDCLQKKEMRHYKKKGLKENRYPSNWVKPSLEYKKKTKTQHRG